MSVVLWLCWAEDGQVYDYRLAVSASGMLEFRLWSETMPSFAYSKKVPYFQVSTARQWQCFLHPVMPSYLTWQALMACCLSACVEALSTAGAGMQMHLLFMCPVWQQQPEPRTPDYMFMFLLVMSKFLAG
jgi:hypothetical protein